MKNFSKKLILLLLILGINLVFFNLVYATDKSPVSLVKSAVETGIKIGLALALLVIIRGGVCYLLSLGGIEVIGTTRLISFGREQIKAGITALLILGCFYSLMSVINPGWTQFHPFEGIVKVGEEKLEEHHGGPFLTGVESVLYDEIPLGTTIENVLARQIDCFKFDVLGDITDANSGTSEFEPLLNHDRLDCAYEVIKTIRAKSKEVVVLMKEYQELLKQCGCQYCKCTCDGCGQQACGACTYCDDNLCRCSGSYCSWINCGKKCCPCERGTPAALCQTDKPQYDVCHPVREKMEDFWEEYFESDNEVLSDFLDYEKKYFKCISDCRKKCIENPNILLEDCVKGCNFDPKRYKDLKIVDQLKYLRKKIEETQVGLERDQKTLIKARNRIEQDYLVEPYIEFIKISEETNIVTTLQKPGKIPFVDSKGEKILPNKYCKGYNYLNYTSCCGDKYLPKELIKELPEEKEEREEKIKELHEKLCFGACTTYCQEEAIIKESVTGGYGTSTVMDVERFYKCLNEHTSCDCYCETLPEDKKGKCKSDCPQHIQECNKQFNWCEPKCEKDYWKEEDEEIKSSVCKTKCDEWVEDGKKQCEKIFEGNDEDIERCKKTFDDELEDCYQNCKTEKETCIEHCFTAYLLPCYNNYFDMGEGKGIDYVNIGCSFCTDQYAGYEECLEDCYYKSPEECKKEYSSYNFLEEDNRKKLRCPYCSSIKVKLWGLHIYNAWGTDMYPRAQKCFPCSLCSECPCLTSSGECGEYAYNDDPLTFYSSTPAYSYQTTGEPEEKYAGPLGEEMYCDEKREIPIGRLTDETIAFADEIIPGMKIVDIELKLIDSLKPDNFKCEGREGLLKDLLKILLETPVDEITTALLDEMLAFPPVSVSATLLATQNGNSIQADTFDLISIPTTSATLTGNSSDEDEEEEEPPAPMPPSVFTGLPTSAHTVKLNWEKGFNADKTMIRRKKGTSPKNRDEGVEIYFGTGTRFVDDDAELTASYCYYSAWGYNSESGLWSDEYTVVGLGEFETTTTTQKEPSLKCQTGCSFSKRTWSEEDEEGNQHTKSSCSCHILPCQGNPTNIEKEIKGFDKIVEIVEHILMKFREIERKRSECLKKLIYSRKEMDSCAEFYVEFRGKEIEEIREKIKCLSCTRVLDEGLRRECYGAKEDAFADPDKTDDWFCCEKTELE